MISTDKLAEIYQLKNVVRYNTRLHLKDENVAEHSYYVALISLMICDKLNLSGDIVNKVLIKALLHDLPESRLNDITYDVKNALNLRPLLKPLEDSYYLENFSSHAELMADESSNIVNVIVKLADNYSVKQYTQNEVLLGNMDKGINDINLSIDTRISDKISELENILKEENTTNEKI